MYSKYFTIRTIQRCSFLAGKKGLNNEVSHVSVADNQESRIDYIVSNKGDFYISSFNIKDDVDALEVISTMIKTQSSGLCITNEYINKLSKYYRLLRYKQISSYYE